jgi:hypothetical protein
MPAWFRRLRARWRYRHFQKEIAREIETHRAMAQSALERSGVEAEAARVQAARALGNVTLMREEARSVWIASWIESLWQDARYAARSFRRRPGFAATVVLILSLGGGLVTAVFSIGYGVFLRPWPVPDPNAVVLLRPRPATAVADYTQISLVEFQYLVEPVDLGQRPAEIVALSFSDSDLAALAAAWAGERWKLAPSCFWPTRSVRKISTAWRLSSHA